MEKKWVFEALVRDENDAEGLLAYSLYKLEKSTRAKTLRVEEKSEEEIQRRLQTFHDDALATRLNKLREQGSAYLLNLSQAIEDGLISDYQEKERQLETKYQAQKLSLEKECKEKIKKAMDDFIKAARSTVSKDRTWWEAIKEEVGRHTWKALGNILAGVIILGLAASILPADMKAAIVLKAFEKAGFNMPASSNYSSKP